MDEEMEKVLLKLKTPLLKEFALYLRSFAYLPDRVEALLCDEWDGAYPSGILSDDILADIANFLFAMAEFAVTKVYRTRPSNIDMLDIWIVPKPSYDSFSYVFVLEMKTRSVLAVGCGCKTWRHNPNAIEEDLKDLIDQLERSKRMLGVRLLVE